MYSQEDIDALVKRTYNSKESDDFRDKFKVFYPQHLINDMLIYFSDNKEFVTALCNNNANAIKYLDNLSAYSLNEGAMGAYVRFYAWLTENSTEYMESIKLKDESQNNIDIDDKELAEVFARVVENAEALCNEKDVENMDFDPMSLLQGEDYNVLTEQIKDAAELMLEALLKGNDGADVNTAQSNEISAEQASDIEDLIELNKQANNSNTTECQDTGIESKSENIVQDNRFKLNQSSNMSSTKSDSGGQSTQSMSGDQQSSASSESQSSASSAQRVSSKESGAVKSEGVKQVNTKNLQAASAKNKLVKKEGLLSKIRNKLSKNEDVQEDKQKKVVSNSKEKPTQTEVFKGDTEQSKEVPKSTEEELLNVLSEVQKDTQVQDNDSNGEKIESEQDGGYHELVRPGGRSIRKNKAEEIVREWIRKMAVSGAFLKTNGYERWDKRKIAKYIVTEQDTKILQAKYKHLPDKILFMLDFSGSCSWISQTFAQLGKAATVYDHVTVAYGGWEGYVQGFIKPNTDIGNIDNELSRIHNYCQFWSGSMSLKENAQEYSPSLSTYLSLHKDIKTVIILGDYDGTERYVEAYMNHRHVKFTWFICESMLNYRRNIIGFKGLQKRMFYFDGTVEGLSKLVHNYR